GPMEPTLRVLGLMSGTSVDGIDAALCEFGPDPQGGPEALQFRLLAFHEQPYPPAIRAQVLALCRPETRRLDALTEMHFALGELFADAALAALRAARHTPESVDLIASHGQTVYHLVEPGR